jgi:transposase
VSVFEGNTGDPKTLMPQVETLQKTFAIEQLVLVGDRGMISQKQINELTQREGIDWITALRAGAIRKLVDGGTSSSVCSTSATCSKSLIRIFPANDS